MKKLKSWFTIAEPVVPAKYTSLYPGPEILYNTLRDKVNHYKNNEDIREKNKKSQEARRLLDRWNEFKNYMVEKCITYALDGHESYMCYVAAITLYSNGGWTVNNSDADFIIKQIKDVFCPANGLQYSEKVVETTAFGGGHDLQITISWKK